MKTEKITYLGDDGRYLYQFNDQNQNGIIDIDETLEIQIDLKDYTSPFIPKPLYGKEAELAWQRLGIKQLPVGASIKLVQEYTTAISESAKAAKYGENDFVDRELRLAMTKGEEILQKNIAENSWRASSSLKLVGFIPLKKSSISEKEEIFHEEKIKPKFEIDTSRIKEIREIGEFKKVWQPLFNAREHSKSGSYFFCKQDLLQLFSNLIEEIKKNHVNLDLTNFNAFLSQENIHSMIDEYEIFSFRDMRLNPREVRELLKKAALKEFEYLIGEERLEGFRYEIRSIRLSSTPQNIREIACILTELEENIEQAIQIAEENRFNAKDRSLLLKAKGIYDFADDYVRLHSSIPSHKISEKLKRGCYLEGKTEEDRADLESRRKELEKIPILGVPTSGVKDKELNKIYYQHVYRIEQGMTQEKSEKIYQKELKAYEKKQRRK